MKKPPLAAVLASLLFIAGVFAFFSFSAPYMADNYVFSLDLNPGFAAFYSGGEVSAKPLSISGAFRQARSMYTDWCGRFTGNLAVYLIFLLPAWLGKALSATGFAAYVLLLQICVFGREWRKSLSPGWLLGIAALLWISVPSFGESFFWLSVGGHIALFAQAAMLLPFRMALDLPRKSLRQSGWSWLTGPLFFLAGAAASSLDYAASASLPGTALAASAWVYFSQKKGSRAIPWILLAGTLGLFIGALLTLGAPGNAQRLALTRDTQVIAWLAMSWPDRIIYWIARLPSLLALLPAPFALLAFGLHAMRKEKGKNFFKSVPVAAIFFLLPFFLTIGAYLFTAWPPPRAFAGCSVFLLLAGLIIMRKALPNLAPAMQSAWRGLKAALAGICVISLIWEAYVFNKVRETAALREKIIAAAQGGEASLPPLGAPAGGHQPLGGPLADLSADPNHWVNRAMALHYGLKKITRQSPPPLFYKACGAENNAAALSLKLSFDKDRLYIRTRDKKAAALLEKGAYIYYYGQFSLLGELWKPLADLIFNLLADSGKASWLLPLLLARADLTPSDSGAWRGPLIRIDNASKIWLVNPGGGRLSFDLIPFEADSGGRG